MNYRYYKETQLVPLAANGDKDAVAELLMVRYREQLVSSARSVNARLSNDDIEDALQNFSERNLKPDSNGNWRLRGLSADHNPLGYVIRSFKNYLRDEFRKEKIDIVETSPDENRTGDEDGNRYLGHAPEPIDDDYDDLHPMTQKELQIEAIFEALESLGDLNLASDISLSPSCLANDTAEAALSAENTRGIEPTAWYQPSTVYNRYSDLKNALSLRAAEYLKKLRE